MEKGNRKPQNYLSREEYLKLPPQEQKAFQELVKMESATKGAHALGRHGPNTTLEQQYIRATTGLTPDGKKGQPVASSRWFNYSDMLSAIKSAKLSFSNNPTRQQDVTFQHSIGEGYLADGTYVKTNIATVYLNKNGELITAFPNLNLIGQ